MSDEKESLLLVVACEKRKNVLVAGFKFLGGGEKRGQSNPNLKWCIWESGRKDQAHKTVLDFTHTKTH